MTGPALAPVLIVTGTGTEVGKTVVTAAIAALAADRAIRVAVVKPAQTGEPPTHRGPGRGRGRDGDLPGREGSAGPRRDPAVNEYTVGPRVFFMIKLIAILI